MAQRDETYDGIPGYSMCSSCLELEWSTRYRLAWVRWRLALRLCRGIHVQAGKGFSKEQRRHESRWVGTGPLGIAYWIPYLVQGIQLIFAEARFWLFPHVCRLKGYHDDCGSGKTRTVDGEFSFSPPRVKGMSMPGDLWVHNTDDTTFSPNTRSIPVYEFVLIRQILY